VCVFLSTRHSLFSLDLIACFLLVVLCLVAYVSANVHILNESQCLFFYTSSHEGDLEMFSCPPHYECGLCRTDFGVELLRRISLVLGKDVTQETAWKDVNNL